MPNRLLGLDSTLLAGVKWTGCSNEGWGLCVPGMFSCLHGLSRVFERIQRPRIRVHLQEESYSRLVLGQLIVGLAVARPPTSAEVARLPFQLPGPLLRLGMPRDPSGKSE